ncbi:MAG: DUF3307 domain-containing protein [Candidatus Promineofilum sp.]|nr:DUF3307 domain-containing protein [Promineifilum sp.]
MIIAMFLAHLVGDFVLQWDGLAAWKAREMKGVIVHSLILFLATAALALLFRPYWWSGVFIISISHFIVDALQFLFKPRLSPLLRFILDQTAHFFFIILALALGGYLAWGDLAGGIADSARAAPVLTAILGYAFLTMPAWVLLKFTVYAMVNGQPPDFPAGPNKFVGITERLIISTMVAFGLFLLVPLVALPRLIVEWPQIIRRGSDGVYVAELIASVGLAVGVGLGISLLA